MAGKRSITEAAALQDSSARCQHQINGKLPGEMHQLQLLADSLAGWNQYGSRYRTDQRTGCFRRALAAVYRRRAAAPHGFLSNSEQIQYVDLPEHHHPNQWSPT